MLLKLLLPLLGACCESLALLRLLVLLLPLGACGFRLPAADDRRRRLSGGASLPTAGSFTFTAIGARDGLKPLLGLKMTDIDCSRLGGY